MLQMIKTGFRHFFLFISVVAVSLLLSAPAESQPRLTTDGPLVLFIRDIGPSERTEIHCPVANGLCQMVDTNGDALTPAMFNGGSGFRATRQEALVKIGSKYGMLRRDGSWTIAPVFERIRHFPENEIARAYVDGKWGFVDRSPRWVIPPQFEYADAFSDGLAKVKRNNKSGFINARGEAIIPIKYDTIYPKVFTHGLVPASLDGKYGYLDKRGRWVIAPTYEFTDEFATNGLALAEKDGKYGYIDINGNWAIPNRFDNASGFSPNGLARAKSGSKYGFIDSTGHFAIPAKFDAAISFGNDTLTGVRIGDKFTVIDQSGHERFAPRDYKIIFGYGNSRFAKFEQNSRYGLIDRRGNVIVPAIYRGLARRGDNFKVTYGPDGSSAGLINANGTPLTFSKSDFQLAEMQAIQADQSNDLQTAKAEIARLQAELNRAKQTPQRSSACDHVYQGLRFDGKERLAGLISIGVTYEVLGFSPITESVTVRSLNGGNSYNIHCSQVSR